VANFRYSLLAIGYSLLAQGEFPVLITSAGIRPHVRAIIERFRPQTMVMSQNEVHPRARLKTIGSVQPECSSQTPCAGQ
jgi:flagellar biosynthesis component FlhA